MNDRGGRGAAIRVIRMKGALDMSMVSRLAGDLVEMSPGTEVCLDVTDVSESNDSMALLAEAIRYSDAHVSLRGLCEHQARLLRFLGVKGEMVELRERHVRPDRDTPEVPCDHHWTKRGP